MSAYDITKWKNITPEESYGLGHVWQRFTLLAKDDPYVGFFSEHVHKQLAFAVTEAIGDDARDKITVAHPETLRGAVQSVLSKSPLARLLTSEFRTHIAGLFVTATFPIPEGTPVCEHGFRVKHDAYAAGGAKFTCLGPVEKVESCGYADLPGCEVEV